MTCYDVRARLSALLDGAVPPDEKGGFMRHVDACADCRSELDALSGTDRVLRQGMKLAVESSAPSEYFESFAARVLERAGLAKQEKQEVGQMDVTTKPTPKVEMTGLHDLQLLARNTKERLAQKHPDEAEADLLAAVSSSGSFGSVVLPEPGREVAPPVMNAPPPAAVARASAKMAAVAAAGPVTGFGAGVVARKPSRLPAVLVSLIVVLGAAGVGVWYFLPQYLAKNQQAAPAVAAVETTPTPAVEPIEAPAAAPAPPAGAAATTAQQPETAAPADSDSASAVAAAEPSEHRERDRKRAKGGDADKVVALAKPEKTEKPEKAEKPAETPAPTPAPKPAREESKDIDDLLNEASGGAPAPGGGGTTPAADSKPEEKAPESLTSGQVRQGMSLVKAKVQACYTAFKVPGVVEIKVKIENDGTVSSTEPVGKFAGTETGTCVADAVKHAPFPRFSGPPMSLKYPFRLQ
jgi:hypothetical protein